MAPWSGERIIETMVGNQLYRVTLREDGNRHAVQRVIFGEEFPVRRKTTEWWAAIRKAQSYGAQAIAS